MLFNICVEGYNLSYMYFAKYLCFFLYTAVGWYKSTFFSYDP